VVHFYHLITCFYVMPKVWTSYPLLLPPPRCRTLWFAEYPLSPLWLWNSVAFSWLSLVDGMVSAYMPLMRFGERLIGESTRRLGERKIGHEGRKPRKLLLLNSGLAI